MGTLNRFYGAFLGLAVGDAIAAQTRGVERPGEVPLVSGPDLAGTNETQHFARTAKALVVALGYPYDRRVVGREVASELIAWYHDPATQGRHPGRSSRASIVRLLEGTDWESSGNPDSDGADPLPRAVAVGLAWAPDEVVEPAVTVTSVTHRHPTALQAAVITAWLVSSLARGARLEAALVEEACRLGAAAVPAGTAIRSVDVALDVVRRTQRDALPRIDPSRIPLGDCGERCGSALALAILLALMFEEADPVERFEKAVSAAARLPGCPEVVGALTGALLGATFGLGAVPRDFIEQTEDHHGLADLARALHVFAHGKGTPAESSASDVEPGEAWEGAAEGDPFVKMMAGPVESATDTEWLFGEPLEGAARPSRVGRHPVRRLLPQPERGEGVEWIRVADEKLAEMEAADADLLAEVHRRW